MNAYADADDLQILSVLKHMARTCQSYGLFLLEFRH